MKRGHSGVADVLGSTSSFAVLSTDISFKQILSSGAVSEIMDQRDAPYPRFHMSVQIAEGSSTIGQLSIAGLQPLFPSCCLQFI